MPTADKILPYLSEIDQNRYYTNFGPLVEKFEKRLAAQIGVKDYQISTFSNGTRALELAIRAMNLPAGGYVILPSWTFIATAQAVLNCGLLPYFVDIDAESWSLQPEAAVAAIKSCESEVVLVLPVAPFGLKPDYIKWSNFSRKYKMPILIDGASLYLDDVKLHPGIVTMVSFHATKLLNCGEGGMLVGADEDIIFEARKMSTFNIYPEKIAGMGTNGKLSEYHAAIGLASLDEKDKIKEDFMRVARRYDQNLSGQGTIALRSGYGKSFCAATCHVIVEGISQMDFSAAGVQVKKWWRDGCHQEEFLKKYAKLPLPVTNKIAKNTIGIPCFRDMSDAQIDYVCDILMQQGERFDGRAQTAC